MALSLQDEIKLYEQMIEDSTRALAQLSKGAQESVTVEGRSYTFMDRNALLSHIADLKAVLFDLQNPGEGTFQTYQIRMLS